jgi:Xaa-Pro aminopeptidase
MNAQQFKRRIGLLGARMREADLDVLLLTKPSNMFYLTGDGRLCAYTMITQAGQVALGVPVTDVEDVKAQAYHDLIVGFDDEVGMIHSIAHYFKHFGISEGTLGLEYTFLTQSMMAMLTHPHAKPKNVVPKDCTHLLSEMRMIKEPEEIMHIRQAALVADMGMMAAIQAVREGTTESMVAAEAEYGMRRSGAEGFWRSYVSSGPRTNIAHGLPTNRRLESGDLVLIDLHPIVEGYCADICRTVCVGKPTPEQQAAYDLFHNAQQSTINLLKSGVSVADLETYLHGLLKEDGHEDHIFGPPIHGVGIDFEEAPLPPGHAFFHGEKAPPPLPANVIIAVGNCGLYTGLWGVRVEDTNWVKSDGYEMLTNYPRFLRA